MSVNNQIILVPLKLLTILLLCMIVDIDARMIQRIINRWRNRSPRFGDDVFGTCDGCFCVPEEGDECPVEREPETVFTDLIPILRSFTLENPIDLNDCDPYDDADCDTVPTPLEEGGACVATFTESCKTSCPNSCSYSLSTYPGTYEEAVKAGFYVTHAGACGLCSSFEDLAVYLEVGANMKDLGFQCAMRGRRDPEDGLFCYEEDVGFSPGCAKIWHYNTKNTSEQCFRVCFTAQILNRPPNGPSPLCELSRCVQCDEDHSGQVFSKYAGRTRRNSGLKSNIIRPCSQLINIEQNDPCDFEP